MLKAARTPRQVDKAYTSWLHELPCVVTGHIGEGVQQAHIRYVDFENRKDLTGGGRKPDDRWSLPLWWEEHNRQHAMNERNYWKGEGKDPLELCRKLEAFYPDTNAATVFILAQVSRQRRSR